MIEGPPLLPVRPEYEPPRRSIGGLGGRVANLPLEKPVDLAVDSVELLREFERTGRPDVFEAFMRRHASMVYATCLKVTRDPHDAEDATQATFLTLASKAHLSGDIRQPEAWLRKVAHRLSLDLIRSKKRRVNRENLRSEMTSEEAPLDSHDHADAGEVKTILNEELQKLPASYRMPLILHYFGGLSREEMAAQLKLKPSTLGVRLHRAREQLRKRLANRGVALPVVAITALLTEGVRQSVCASIIPATASKASAIALGHAAPNTFGITASSSFGSGSFGSTVSFASIRSILAVTLSSKLKFSIVAIVLSCGISMTSASVRNLIPEVIKSILPSFVSTPSLPKMDLSIPVPRIMASADPKPAPVDDYKPAVAIARSGALLVSNAVAAVDLPRAKKVFASGQPIAATSGVAVASPRSFSERPAALPSEMSLNSAVVIANGAHAKSAASSASQAMRSKAAIAFSLPSPSSGRPKFAGSSSEPVMSAPAVAMESSFAAVGSILTPSNALFGGGDAGIAIPEAVATNNAKAMSADELPAKAGSSVTGPVPTIPKATGAGMSAPPATSTGGSATVVASSGQSPGSYGGGGTTTPGGSVTSAVKSGGRNSGGSVAVNVPSPGADGGKPASPVVKDVPVTSVFTGVASNYGGYSDVSWQPTVAGDLTNAASDAPQTPITEAFAASIDAPTVEGEVLSINGARVTVHGTSGAKKPTVRFVDTVGQGVPAFPAGHTFFGVWNIDSDETFTSADLLVRYDDLRAARLGLHEQMFKLWVSDGTSWELLWKDPTFGRDAEQNLLWVTASHDFKYFAVSSPEPATLAAVIGVMGVMGVRRRRP